MYHVYGAPREIGSVGHPSSLSPDGRVDPRHDRPRNRPRGLTGVLSGTKTGPTSFASTVIKSPPPTSAGSARCNWCGTSAPPTRAIGPCNDNKPGNDYNSGCHSPANGELTIVSQFSDNSYVGVVERTPVAENTSGICHGVPCVGVDTREQSRLSTPDGRMRKSDTG